jgi:mannose/cellobiose epimerase-like protein (N-acyl-D-glucosamine 2-epimerase family)
MYGEWFGELNREGQPLLRHKITPDKGCCYLVRNLTTLSQLLEIAADLQPKKKKEKLLPPQSTSK